MGTKQKKLATLIKDPRFDYLVIAILVLVICLLNLLWRGIETRPPHWDMGRHLWNSLNYLDLFRAKSHLITTYYTYYPPLLYLLTIPFYLLFHPSVTTAIASNSIYVAILGFATYALGRDLWGRKVGLLATFFVLSSPMIVTQFKEYQIDAPLAAFTVLAIWLLVRTKEFSNRRYSWILGVVIGLGMLLKWTFPFVLAVPLGYAGLLAIYRSVREKNIFRIKNLLLLAVLAYAIAAPWYLSNFSQIKIDLIHNSGQAGLQEGDPLVGTTASNLWYIDNLLNNQLFVFPAILFLVGLVATFGRRINLRKNVYPILLFIGVIGFFSVLQNKDARYTLPALPAVAILSCFWIAKLNKVWSYRLGGLVILYSAAIFLIISFGFKPIPNSVVVRLIPPYRATIYRQSGYIIGPPTIEQWHQEDAYRYMSSVHAKSVFAEGPDTMWFNGWGTRYYSVLYRIPLADSAKEANYLLVRGGQPDPQALKVYSLPDGTVLSVVHNR